MNKANLLLNEQFKMNDMGQIKFFLGMKITTTSEVMLITQLSYIYKILEQFKMVDCKFKLVSLSPDEDFKRMDFPIILKATL